MTFFVTVITLHMGKSLSWCIISWTLLGCLGVLVGNKMSIINKDTRAQKRRSRLVPCPRQVDFPFQLLLFLYTCDATVTKLNLLKGNVCSHNYKKIIPGGPFHLGPSFLSQHKKHIVVNSNLI